MPMIKLGNGDYVNTAAISQILKVIDGSWVLWMGADDCMITSADCDRIVAAMNGEGTDDGK